MMCDVNRQLNGDAPLQHTPPVITCQLPERDDLAHRLSDQHPGKLNVKQLHALCIEVCCLYVRLGRLREPACPRVKQFLAGLAAPGPAPKSSSPSPVPKLVDESSSSSSPERYSLPSPLSPASSSWSPHSPSPVTSASSWTSYTYTDDSGVSSSPALSESSYNSQRYASSNDSPSCCQYQALPPVAVSKTSYSGIFAPVSQMTTHVLPCLAV